MVKAKLNAKNIQYTEENFGEIADKLKIDRAPVMEIEGEIDFTKKDIGVEVTFLQSPSDMVAWINTQE